MDLSIAISSCPNDTFMFDAIINKRIDTKDYKFNLEIADIEKLNRIALKQESDITKLSFHTLFKVLNNYQLLYSGSALGKNCGPLLISKKKIYPDELKDCKIAIPGKNTSANLILEIFYPEAKNKSEYLFSDIEELILENEADAGLIIHETRFLYADKGLLLISDLGKLWEDKFNLYTPLGGIAIKRELREDIKKDINQIISESIKYALSNPLKSLNFIKQNAVSMSEEVIYKHIDLYVNELSIHLDQKGKESIIKLQKEFVKLHNNFESQNKIFID